MKPCTLHIDFDAFFASVEQLRNPQLQGRPVIVGNGVIASCSYEARRFGCSAGMSLRQARKLCPHVVILDGNYPVYRCFGERVFELCGEFACGMETFLDEAYCDLTGTERYHRGYMNAAIQLKKRITEEVGLSVTIGLGPNRMVAKMAGKSVKPNGVQYIREADVDAFIRNRQIEDLPGIGRATAKKLHNMGIQTVSDLREVSMEDLQVLLGINGIAIYERARGNDTQAVNEREIPRTISRETSFHKETIDLDEIHAMFYYLTERALRTTRGHGLKVRTVTTRIRYNDFKGEARSRTLPEPTVMDSEIYEVVLDTLKRIYTRRAALRHVGIVLSNFTPDSGFQTPLFDERQEARFRSLYRSIDTIRERFGHSALVVGRSLDLLGKLEQDSYGYVLRTPSLTK
ncbi:MAG: DNA polymerase IV [Planctomycetota bacterium]|nr:DNA polymerase IV [Planctomycetota bacterium]MDP7131051.1 DNA polymerase IV [Planctomycetota bacterium]MDP7249216.1 DNA polymerase IV [Planctomycetota bacterium]